MEGRRGGGYSNYGRGGSAGRGRGRNQRDQSYQGYQYHQRGGGGGGGRGRGTHHMGDGPDNRSPVEDAAAGGFGGGRGRGTHHIGGGHDNQAVAAGGFGGGRGGRGRGTHHRGGGHANSSPGQAAVAGGLVGGRGRGTHNGVEMTLTGLPSLLLLVGWDPQQEEVFGSIGFSYPYSSTGQQMQQHPPQNPERPNQSSDPVQLNVETP